MRERALESAYWVRDTSVALEETTIGRVLAHRAEQHPTRLALVGNAHGSGAERRLTYAELYSEARRVAAAIRLVVEPGERLALWAPNVVEWPIILYGAALAGIPLVAINPVFRGPELAYVLRHSKATALFHAAMSRDYDMAAVVREVAPTCPALRTIVSLSEHARWQVGAEEPIDETRFTADASDPTAIAMVQYTSGTTGNPKGVLLRHRSIYNNARLTMNELGAPEGFVGVNPLPMFHTAACVIGTLGPLSKAGTSVLVEKFSGDTVLDYLEAERANALFYVPTVLGAVLEAARARKSVRQLDFVLGGAALVPPSVVENTEKVFGTRLHILYGMTELSPVTTLTREGDARDVMLFSVGRPMPQVDIRIAAIDEPRATLPVGKEGEICARGYQQMVEYLGDPLATTAAVDAEGWLHTGDLGTMDAHGVIRITGRLKELIIRGGENIAPAQIEAHLIAHERVLQVAAVGIPDEKWGEILAAVIVLRGEGGHEGLREELVAHARRALAPFKVPSLWFVATELPLTASGKVRKATLRDLVLAGAFTPLL